MPGFAQVQHPSLQSLTQKAKKAKTDLANLTFSRIYHLISISYKKFLRYQPIEHTQDNNDSTWPAFFVTKILSISLWASKSFNIYITGPQRPSIWVKYQSFALHPLILVFKRFGSPKWFWQNNCHKKARHVEPFLSYVCSKPGAKSRCNHSLRAVLAWKIGNNAKRITL